MKRPFWIKFAPIVVVAILLVSFLIIARQEEVEDPMSDQEIMDASQRMRDLLYVNITMLDPEAGIPQEVCIRLKKADELPDGIREQLEKSCGSGQ